jgi:hypothetical protein
MFRLVIPSYTTFSCIRPGPHLDSEGKEDPRVWFNLPVINDAGSGIITFLIFPYGAADEEFQVVDVEVADSWTS